MPRDFDLIEVPFPERGGPGLVPRGARVPRRGGAEAPAAREASRRSSERAGRPTTAAAAGRAPGGQRFDALVEHGDLRGRRVLDVGCGTGALAAALAERALARVWGVEPSPRRCARSPAAGVPRGVGLKAGTRRGAAVPRRLVRPRRDALVVHLVDRPAAFAEARRVLGPAAASRSRPSSHDHFDGYWAAGFFPSLAAVDRARFPDVPVLLAELEAAGFAAGARGRRVVTRATMTASEALGRLRGRHISTFDLLEPAEVEEGIARAERELPAVVQSELRQAIVVADRP